MPEFSAGCVRIGAAFLLFAGCSAAFGQAWPSRPIRFVVPYAAGGGGDIVVRGVSQKLGERLGQSVVVDNRSGASGNLGTEIVARAAPDGHTLLMANVAPMAINASVHRHLPYDPVKDFTPVSMLATFPNVLVVHPAVAARTVPELVGLAKSRPGELTFASTGAGSMAHLSAELLRIATGVQMVHVPYKGGGPALVEVIAGQVTLFFGSMPASLAHVRGGRLRALALTSLERSAAAPGIPTVAESGFPGFEAVTWIGMVGPAGLPVPVVQRLHREAVAILALAELRERLEGLGADPKTSTPEAFGMYIRSEIGKWAKVVREAGVGAQ